MHINQNDIILVNLYQIFKFISFINQILLKLKLEFENIELSDSNSSLFELSSFQDYLRQIKRKLK